ncbi:KTSC domain-containing protein [Bradyrhizobium sp. SYSU BS000235]|uniref:KTSC domain-containing protein n=1 Tax=Bradyrhizobium sp. SYSU BS000235 TaxID=3411332 RepID=UPI003C7434DA
MPRVASSAIARLEYNAFARELLVVFTTGRTYTYFGVSPEVYDQFGRADSKGAFFNLMIRDRYQFEEHHR